jgi:hypothetical protein
MAKVAKKDEPINVQWGEAGGAQDNPVGPRQVQNLANKGRFGGEPSRIAAAVAVAVATLYTLQ